MTLFPALFWSHTNSAHTISNVPAPFGDLDLDAVLDSVLNPTSKRGMFANAGKRKKNGGARRKRNAKRRKMVKAVIVPVAAVRRFSRAQRVAKRRGRQGINRFLAGIPSTSKQRLVKFKYRQEIILNPVASADPPAFKHFDPMFPSHPDYATALITTPAAVLPDSSHQPLGWDEWAARYSKYVVRRCKITVVRPQQVATDSALTNPIVWGLVVNGPDKFNRLTVGNPSYFLLREKGIIARGTPIPVMDNANGKRQTKSIEFDTRKWFGKTIDGLRELRTGSTLTTTRPVELATEPKDAARERTPTFTVWQAGELFKNYVGTIIDGVAQTYSGAGLSACD